MITIAQPCSLDTTTRDQFLAMLPAIRRQARAAFRSADPEAREEFVAEIVANAYQAFVRLVELGKQDLAFSTPLTTYAIQQVRSGRRVGGSPGSRDILSQRVIARQGLVRQSMYERDAVTGVWCELLIEDRTAGPAETAAVRIDMAAWLRTLAPRSRKIAQALASGETTATAAQLFGVSKARISQFRRNLEASWIAFNGAVPAA